MKLHETAAPNILSSGCREPHEQLHQAAPRCCARSRDPIQGKLLCTAARGLPARHSPTLPGGRREAHQATDKILPRCCKARNNPQPSSTRTTGPFSSGRRVAPNGRTWPAKTKRISAGHEFDLQILGMRGSRATSGDLPQSRNNWTHDPCSSDPVALRQNPGLTSEHGLHRTRRYLSVQTCVREGYSQSRETEDTPPADMKQAAQV